ncbi:6888_t:CDS:2 [Funneliformis geosporum]|nr:6888_t:CDS:2 [Funneliformis geosporum]
MNMVDLQDFKRKLQFKDPTEPEELILDNKKIMTISNIISSEQSDFTLLTELINLKSLSMNRTHLHSLEGFPTLPKLRRLALSDNKLTGGLEAFAKAKLEKLIHLDLSGNKINDLSALEPLRNLPNLKHLSLIECPVTQKANYRDALLEMIPQLYSLDQQDSQMVMQEENQEAEISEEAVSDEAGSESDQDVEANDNEEVSDNEEELVGFNSLLSTLVEASEIEAETNIVPKPRNKGKQVAFPSDLDDRTESESESEYESGEEGPGIDYLYDPMRQAT